MRSHDRHLSPDTTAVVLPHLESLPPRRGSRGSSLEQQQGPETEGISRENKDAATTTTTTTRGRCEDDDDDLSGRPAARAPPTPRLLAVREDGAQRARDPARGPEGEERRRQQRGGMGAGGGKLAGGFESSNTFAYLVCDVGFRARVRHSWSTCGGFFERLPSRRDTLPTLCPGSKMRVDLGQVGRIYLPTYVGSLGHSGRGLHRAGIVNQLLGLSMGIRGRASSKPQSC